MSVYDQVTQALACARFLAHHIPAIACDEAAGELMADVKAAVDAIERIVNRSLPPISLGPCPTLIDTHGKRCSVRLSAPKEAVEVVCPSCGQTHNTEQLFAETVRSSAYQLVPRGLLGVALAASLLPTDERRLREWRSTGKLQPSGYEGKEPLYRLGDAQKLAEEHAAKKRKRTA